MDNLTLIVGVVGTLITTVISIIVSNHKLKIQLVDDVKTPIKEMQKEVNEVKESVTNIKAQVTEMTKSDKLTSDALLSILRHRLTESGHKYIKLGYIVEDELEAFINEYNSYSTLGGNHYVTALYNKIMELPVRSIEEQERKAKKKVKTVLQEEVQSVA